MVKIYHLLRSSLQSPTFSEPEPLSLLYSFMQLVTATCRLLAELTLDTLMGISDSHVYSSYALLILAFRSTISSRYDSLFGHVCQPIFPHSLSMALLQQRLLFPCCLHPPLLPDPQFLHLIAVSFANSCGRTFSWPWSRGSRSNSIWFQESRVYQMIGNVSL